MNVHEVMGDLRNALSGLNDRLLFAMEEYIVGDVMNFINDTTNDYVVNADGLMEMVNRMTPKEAFILGTRANDVLRHSDYFVFGEEDSFDGFTNFPDLMYFYFLENDNLSLFRKYLLEEYGNGHEVGGR